ncbi:MAG: PD-(D/E)XK nuclease family protein [Bacteroidia bacterium]|nr:PD-(D/E)XK nuclease family protein [Bacteroidia bacterium]
MRRFLNEVLEDLHKVHDSFEDLIFILPNKRAGTFLLNAMAGITGKTSFAPKIHSIETFVQEVSGLEYAPSTIQLFELYNTYRNLNSSNAESFVDFSLWASPLLQDFNELDRYLVDANKLFEHLAAIHEINQWDLHGEPTAMISNYLRFWKDLGPLYNSYVASLQKRGMGYPGLVFRKAAETIDTYLNEQKDHSYVFVGFNALTKAESLVIQKILDQSNSEIYWDLDTEFITDKEHDASYFIRGYLSKWPYFTDNKPKGFTAHYSTHKTIHAIGIPREVSQAQYVANLLTTLNEEDEEILNETAVILNDESLLNPILHSLPSDVPEANITMGYPLEKTALAGFFSLIIQTYDDQDTKGWYAKNILSMLAHPIFKRVLENDGEAIIAELRTSILNENPAYVGPETLRSELDNAGVLHLFYPSKPNDANAAINSIRQIISRLKDSMIQMDNSVGLQFLYGFHQVFNQIAEFTDQYDFIDDIPALKKLFENVLQMQQVDMRGEPLQGLQIMGMLESRLLDYRTIIMTSVNEGVIPTGKTHSSLIPFDVKKQFGIPTYKEKDAVYTYHFYRLLQRAESIYLLYDTEPDALAGGEKSRLIMQLETDPLQKGNINSSIAIPAYDPPVNDTRKVLKSPALLEALKTKSKRGFSPTLLSTYIENPFLFYKRGVLGIQDDPLYEETIGPMTMGTIVHESLEHLYSPLLQKTLNPELLESRFKKINSIVQERFRSQLPGGNFTKGKNLLAYKVVIRYLERLITYEIEFSREHDVVILGLEEQLQAVIQDESLPAEGVKLRGTADRIDTVDGVLRVLDYKTGVVNPPDLQITDWQDLIADPKYQKAFQLMCYALMVYEQKSVSDFKAGIISFKKLNNGVQLFGLKEGRQLHPNITPEALIAFKEQLVILFERILDPKTEFEHKNQVRLF